MRNLRLRLLAVAVVAGAAVGCSAVQTPTATVRNAQLGNVTSDGVTLNLDMLVNNPNPVEIPLSDADYTLALSGTKVLDGTVSPKGSLPANGSLPVSVPVKIAWNDLLKARDAITATGGDVPYTFSGDLKLGGAAKGIPLLGEKKVPLSYSGTLPLKQAINNPMTIMQSPAARELARQVLGGRFGL